MRAWSDGINDKLHFITPSASCLLGLFYFRQVWRYFSAADGPAWRIVIHRINTLLVLLTLSAAHDCVANELPYAGSQESIWTDRPVRVDRAGQQYERVPGLFDAFVTKIRIKPQAQAVDGGSFRQDGMIFIIADVVAPDPKRICHADDGSIRACGSQSRAFLKSLINRRFLECRAWSIALQTWMIDCRIGQYRVAETLVASGYVRVARDAGLITVEQDAMRRRAGLWADAGCRLSQRC